MARAAFALVLLAGLAGPVLLPALAVRAPGSADLGRILGLAGTTLALALGACAVAVPTGVAAAVALERIPFVGSRLLRAAVLGGLFVPLPVTAVAWQVVLGTWLPPLALDPGQVAWRPWERGLLPAAWVHGAAGFPWVVWVVSAGLRSADRGLEEDALLDGGPAAVLRRVLLPRLAVAGFAAAGWVAVQTGTEITVTDAMMVRTFAEEVYTQFVGASNGLAAAVAVTVPAWLAAVVGAALLARPVVRTFGEPPADAGEPLALTFPKFVRFLAGIGAFALVAGFVLLPLAALAWKAGGGGTRLGWTAVTLAGELGKVARTDGRVLLSSVLTALAAGVVTAGLAWAACRSAVASRRFGRVLFAMTVVLWVAPGPVVGLGLKDAISLLLDAEEALRVPGSPLRAALYDGPSPLPVLWAAVVRLFPVAIAVLWPAVRAVPRDLWEASALDGLGLVGEFRVVLLPLTGPAAGRAALAVAALALGEVSASKLVAPPGTGVFVLTLFDQMHYGAESTVAALAMLQLLGTAAAGGVLLWAWESPRSGTGSLTPSSAACSSPPPTAASAD